MNRDSVVIFGASEAGKAALGHISSQYSVIGFVDNNQAKQGGDFCNLPVYAPEQIHNLAIDKVLIASEYSEHIARQLSELAISVPWSVLPARLIKPRHFGDSPQLVENGERLLGLVSEFLIKHAYRHYVDAGTLLGIVRDGEFILWDDDLDIALHAQDSDRLSANSAQLTAFLQQQTHQQWRLDWYTNAMSIGAVPKGGLRAAKLSCASEPETWPLLDFFVKYIDGPRMDYCLSSRMISMPAVHFAQTHKRNFKDKMIMFPDDVEAYLSHHYGNWRTPQKDWCLADLSNARLIE